VAAACPEVDFKEVAFWLLLSELGGCDLHVRNNMCGFDTSAAVSERDQAAVDDVSVKEAPVPCVDRLTRTELSPSVDPYHVGSTESPPKVGNAALASGISGPPVHTEQRSVAVFGRTEFSPTVDLSPRHGERTEFSPRYEQKQEQKLEQERLSAQSIGKAGLASDGAVGRLAVLSSLDVMSEEATVSVVDENALVNPVSSVLRQSWPQVVLQTRWCPGLGRAVVSVRQAVGAGFGCLAGGMPVIRADAAGLVREAIVRVADEHVLVKEVPIEAVDALSMVVEISEWCEAVPAGMESMGLLIKVLQIVLSPAVCGAVFDRYICAFAVLARMAFEIVDPGSDPPQPSYLVAYGCDSPMMSCC
jgi:hypothetical protein